MKADTKSLSAILLSIVFAASVFLMSLAHVKAAPAPCSSTITCPYFKVYGGDIMTGGWFNRSSVCDASPSSNYQDPTYKSPPGAKQNGGILAYAKSNGSGKPKGGASSEFAAYVLGLVENNDANKWGFYSDGALRGTSNIDTNYLSFANNDTANAPWGGLFEGTVRQSNCIPDYYITQQRSPTAMAAGTAPNLSDSTTAGQYKLAPSGSVLTLNSSAATIQAGAQITLFVDGNVYIGANITYALDKVTNVPKFTLVARGSIYIDPAVTQLDGLYIAQPDAGYDPTKVVADDEGVIWTCHSSSTGQVADAYPYPTCNNRLVVNGALIAKQVNFMRTKGNVFNAPDPASGEETLSAANSSTNIAEIINYTPAMIIGGGFFNPGNAASLKVQSVISLPPIF